MLTPFDKLQSGRNKIIQVIVSHRCNLSCSACTQGMGYRKYDISIDAFREAVRSLNDWPGTVALFGRNPVLHPRFSDLCQILCEEIPDQSHRGLWCNDLMNDEIGQICRDTFYPLGDRNCNAHGVAEAYERFEKWLPGWAVPASSPNAERGGHSLHAPVRTAIQDYIGTEQIPDEAAMWRQIEGCDINRDWSGAVYERDGRAVAAFCEIAAAFDIWYGTNHGVLVEAGWWKWGMDQFDHQHKQWCRQCGVPLRLPGVLDSDETDHYSTTHEPLVKASGRGIQKRAVRLNVLPSERKNTVTRYIGAGSA